MTTEHSADDDAPTKDGFIKALSYQTLARAQDSESLSGHERAYLDATAPMALLRDLSRPKILVSLL